MGQFVILVYLELWILLTNDDLKKYAKKDIFNKICAFILKVLYMNGKMWYNVFTDFVRINF